MKKHFLDLFSGLGGASQAFIEDRDNWTVLRVDNNPLLSGVPNTMMRDIQDLANHVQSADHTIDVIWASPPCRDFSGGYNSPKSIAIREIGIDNYKPDMSLLIASLKIIEIVKPKYFIVENVAGSIRYFQEFLGAPRQIIGPYVLWGNFPYVAVDESKLESKKSKDKHSANPLRSNYKAKVDYELSRALKEAIENQKSIFQY